MSRRFDYVRLEGSAAEPPRERGIVDVAVLDMNHRWPNLGHDGLVYSVREAAESLAPDVPVRVISYDVRSSLRVPRHEPGRFALYLGSGGPGHLDPRANDGVSPLAQGINENPAWEKPLFSLFDAVENDSGAALLGVCHTFGLLARWSGAAQPVVRSEKSAGIAENFLTDAAAEHPWFSRFLAKLPTGRRFPVVDNRLFDLVPTGSGPAALSTDGPESKAVTMIEFARDFGGVMPRMLAVNHHPEVYDRARQKVLIGSLRQRGEVSAQWLEERERIIRTEETDPAAERRIRQTSDYTLLLPLRFHLSRALAQVAGGSAADPRPPALVTP